MTLRPTLTQIIKTDFIALVAAIASPVCLFMAGLAAAGWLPALRGSESASFFVMLAAGALVGGALALAWRAAVIREALAGRTVEATIVKFTRFKDRGYLHYRYAVGGREIQTFHFVHLSAAADRLRVGQSVTVGVHPRKPKQAFVRELFQG